MNCIIIDLDNCIFNDGHRKHYLETMPKNWDAYFDECDKDEPFIWAESLIEMVKYSKYVIVFLTGRPVKLKDKTMHSLYKFFNLSENDYCLHMRQNYDFTPANMYKENFVIDFSSDYINIIFAIDDDCKVAEMYKRNGITCLVPWDQKRE